MAGCVMSLLTLARELEDESRRTATIADMEKFIDQMSAKDAKLCLIISTYLVGQLADSESLSEIGLRVGASEPNEKVILDPRPRSY